MENHTTRNRQAEHINKILFDIADAVNTTEDLNELYNSIHHTLSSAFDVTNFFIAIVDREERTLYFPYHVDTVDDDFSPLDDFDTESSLTGLVVTEKKPILLREEDLKRRRNKDGIWGPSPLIWMGCPLVIRDEVIGVIAVQSYTDADIYDENDLQLLTAVCHQIAMAIDRKRFLDKLQESEKRLNSLVKNSSDSLVIVKANGDRTYINPAIESITGFTIQELESMPFNAVIHPDDLTKVIKAWKKAIEHPDKPVTLEYRHIHKTRGWAHSEVVMQSFFEEPSISGVIASVRDISERKEREKEMLTNEKLSSLGILAGGIAHDFNNILAGIMGNISLAQMFLDKEHRSYELLSKAERATSRAEELAYQLLTFSRGGEPVKSLISINNLIRESTSLTLRGTNIKASVEIPETIYAIEADEGQINQVFNNLIINASQAMPDGGTLKISAKNEAALQSSSNKNPYVRMTITDEGCGIPDSSLKKIFDPYYSTKPGGNGLGLASVYSIINKHGGRIEVQSEVNKGTTFHILLPSLGLVYESVVEKQMQDQPLDQRVGKILVMDDEEMILEIARSMLTELGYEVTTCNNSEEAVRLYQDSMDNGEIFKAAIMDLTIPGGTGGKEAAKQILTIHPDAYLIVSSGYSNDPIMSKFHEYGFCGTLAKPYNLNDIANALNQIEHLLDNRSATIPDA